MAFDIGALLGRMKLSKQGFSAGLLSAEKDLKGFTTKGTSHMKMLGGAILAVTGVVSGLVGTLAGIVIKTANYGDEIQKMSDRTGIAVETLSTLAYAADLNDASLADLQTGIRGLVMAMDSAKKSGGDTAYAFAELGVDFLDAQGNLRSTEDMLFELSDALMKTENDSERNALAIKLFGRSAESLLPLLRSGSTGIKELQQRARELGLELSGKSTSDAVKFNDSLADVKWSLWGLVSTIGGPMIEVMQPMLDDLAKWIGKNRELVEQDVKKWTKETAEGIRDLVQTLAGMKKDGSMADFVEGGKMVGSGIERAFYGARAAIFMVVSALGSAGTSIEKMMGKTDEQLAAQLALLKTYKEEFKEAGSFAWTGDWGVFKKEWDTDFNVEAKQKVDVTVKLESSDNLVTELTNALIPAVAMPLNSMRSRMVEAIKAGVSRSVDQGLLGK